MFNIDDPTPTALQAETLRRLFADDGGARFALGRNKYAVSVASTVQLTGFIDDYTDEREFLGLPVLRTDDVPLDATVVSCVTEAHPVSAMRRLEARGISHAVDYFTLQRAKPGRFEAVAYMEGNREDVVAHMSKYEALFDRLADDQSRDVLRRVVEFRCTGDISRMTVFPFATQRQYFEEFVTFADGEIFVDGGGFDGENTLQFIRRCPTHGAIHFFEPNADMLETARQRLSGVSQIHFLQKGLFDCETQLRFDGASGSASRISETGDDAIDVTTIDLSVAGRVDFIKLDVEGAECKALAGAAHHIAMYTPKLAVCVYHNQSDFWHVPELVLALCPSYRIHLRHYTEGVLETVMFFIPEHSRIS